MQHVDSKNTVKTSNAGGQFNLRQQNHCDWTMNTIQTACPMCPGFGYAYIEAHNIWKEAGRPSQGDIHRLMRQAKLAYKMQFVQLTQMQILL